MNLRKWQERAKQLWYNKDCKGTVDVCTGAGKTIFAISIIKETPGNITILVPTQQLLRQWKKKLEENIPEKIGVFYGTKKDVQRITVAVFNSIWDKAVYDCNLLVFDECHKARANLNSKFLTRNSFNKVLGLSATTKNESKGNSDYFFKLAPVFFWYSIRDAQRDNVLATYETKYIQAYFNEKERVIYNKADVYVKDNLGSYDYNLIKVIQSSKKFDHKAMNIMRAVNKRKSTIFSCEDKLAKTIETIQNNQDKKIILFDERIDNLTYFALKLSEIGIKTSIYHSKLKSKQKSKLFDDFASNKVNVMLSAKSLEEGIDVPQCDVAIIVNGSQMKRQHIQRVGRVLRITENKNHAIIYQIYVPNTKDEDWMRKRS